MEKERFNIVVGDQPKADITVRETNVLNELKVMPPVKINLSGTIESVFEFLNKRLSEVDQINQKRCHILVDRENISITLITTEHEFYQQGQVKGTLELHPKFEEFGINTGKVWAPSELGMYFKMNRAFFESKDDNMKLVTDLMNFKASVDNKIERSMKENGDRKDNFAQIVNSNLPKSFKLIIPIFKARQPEIIEVETFAQINGRDVAFTLLSPGAQETLENIRDNEVDSQLKKIRELAPDIAIIEQ